MSQGPIKDAPAPVLSAADFRKISELAHRKFGLSLKSGKEGLVAARLGKKIRQGGFRSFADYHRHILEDRTGQALVELIDSLTTNHTCFLRERAHFDFLGQVAAGEFQAYAALRAWSAACSTGEEPYSLAMYLTGVARKEACRWSSNIRIVDIQRWLLPMVKTGAQDWVAAGNLNYATTIQHVPVVVNQDSWSLLRSTLPKGSMLYTQIYTQHRLLRRGDLKLFLREGPQYTYAWGFYGAQGNRIVRYGGCLALLWKNTSFEAGYRQQFGLQDGIRNNRYWSFLITRQTTKAFHSEGS